MNKIISFILLNLTAVTAYAACEAIPFNLTDGNKRFIGQITAGGECRGVTSRVNNTAVHYVFQGKAGDTVASSLFLSDTCNLCGSQAYVVLLDPQGLQLGNAAYDKRGIRDHFSTTLMTSGTYKLIVTGNALDTKGVLDYAFDVNVSPNKDLPLPVASCPADTYSNGKLIINSVEVPDGLGGVIKYQANLSLLPFSNPLSFALDRAQPLQ
ncbi:MAG: hypothetical protein QX203_12910 [Methylococcaceae bacterium]